MVRPTNSLPTLLRPREICEHGLTPSRFRRLVRDGALERVSRGLYLNPAADHSEFLTIAGVFKRAPRAIVCLYSALELHDIGTQWPKKLWIAIDRKDRIPTLEGVGVRIVRFSGPMLTAGILTRTADGVPYRITSPARTIVDCFRYRRKFGLDVALEALRDGLRGRHATGDEIATMAKSCRSYSVIRPYLAAMLA